MPNHDPFVFITGASSGMGEATALLLSAERNLILQGRDEQRLTAVGSTCSQQGHDVLLFPYDFEDVSNLGEDLANFVKSNELTVDAIVHFAGMTEVLPLARSKYTIGLQVMNVNFFSATEILTTLLKKRINAKVLKNVVFVSSIATVTGKKYQPYYCSSKGAIEALTTALACELSPHIRVNCISPGSFNTRITKNFFSDSSGDIRKPRALLQTGFVGEVAKAARFLLSEESAYITGQILFLDGGERFFGIQQ